MAFVPLAALAALAGTTTALYQNATKDKNKKVIPVLQPTRTYKPNQVVEVIPSKPLVFGPSAYKMQRQSQRKRQSRQQRARRVVSAPTARGGITPNLPPRLSGNGQILRINHCEPFVAVNMTALGVLDYARSPLIPASMPYLTGVAANFGKWRWTKLVLYYVPSCPTSADGEMAFATIFDRQDAPSATFVQVASMTGGVTTPPWGGGPFAGPGAVRVVVDCSRFDKPRYSYMTTANFNALTASDQNNYCPVTLARATQGNTAGGAVMGRVWADYSIELLDPIVAGLNV